MVRLYSPHVFAVGAMIVLALAVIEKALDIDMPKIIPLVPLVACMAGLIGVIATEGTGRVYPLPPPARPHA